MTRYLDFKTIDGSFVVKGGKINKVPATPKEALASSLMGMFEKRRFRNFLIYMNDYDPKNPSTHKGYNLNTMTVRRMILLKNPMHFECFLQSLFPFQPF